jgi:RNA polymerase sigma factor (sigma-70 family)
LDEAAWIAASKGGDVQAFNRLVIAHQDSAYGLALRMLKDRDAAADATQDAFISAFTRLHQFRGGSFKAWLLRIVLNRVYDDLRRSQRHPTDSLDTLAGDEDAPVLQIPSGVQSPEDAALSAELMACIEAGLTVLPPEQRAAVILVDVQGMSYEETAEATAASLGTVKSRVSRGRQAMRDYLSSHVELLPSSIRHYFEKMRSDQSNSATMAADRQTES